MITLTYQYKLKLNKQQTQEIEHILSVCKSVYNYALAERKHWHNSRKSPVNSCSIHSEYIIPADAPYPNYNYQAKNLTIAKKTSQNLKSVNAQVLQQTLKTLDRAFSDMKAKGFGFSRFKKQLLLKAIGQLKLLQRRLKHKTKGSKNWLKLQNKIAKIHEKIANTRRDWHFKLANYLCDLTDNIFVEDINFVSWSRGIVRKQSLDSGIGRFINEILPYVCWKRSKFYLKVDNSPFHLLLKLMDITKKFGVKIKQIELLKDD